MDPLPAIVLPPTPPPSLGERLVGTFVAPGKLGERLRDHPRWVAPALLAAFLIAPATLSFYATDRGWAMMKPILVESFEKQGQKIDPDLLGVMRWGAAASSAVCPFVAEALVIAAGAGICLLIFTYAMGREGRFVHYVAVISHVYLILAAGMVVTVAMQLASGNLYASPSLAPLLKDRSPTDPLLSALSAVNFFSLWAIVACGTMIGGMTRKGSGAPIAVLGTLYTLLMAFVIGVGWFFQRGGAA